MYKKILQDRKTSPIRQKSGEFILVQSDKYLSRIQKELFQQIDTRLARTFFDLFIAILSFRNRSMGLLLTELGGYVSGFKSAPAGTKKISNLLRCKGWTHQLIDNFFFNRGKERIEGLTKEGKRPLLLWDDSRIEKPESWFLQGLCSVYSSKASRLTKIKPGYYTPPGTRIHVPGYKWTGIILSNLGGVPSVFHMAWWTTRGVHKEWGSNIIYRMLRKVNQEIGSLALHVLDRGYASIKMLEWLTTFKQRFLIRWKVNHLLINEHGVTKKTHLVARSYKGKDSQIVWDKERKKSKRITVAWAPVTHPELPDNQLYLVIVRDKNNFNSPMYLLTDLVIENEEQAWEICFSYIHRWEIEQAFRCCKSELAMESPRLWFFQNTLKLLAIVSLVYDFLLRMLRNWKAWTEQLFANWCPRTGNRYRLAKIPIYRLRAAVANCMLALFYEQYFLEQGYFEPQHVNTLLMG